jgi:hypothetical protein
MSDVVRNYSRSRRRKRREPRWRTGCLRLLVFLLIMAAVVLWAVWATRDTHDMGDLIPADQRWQIWLNDVLRNRHVIAQSRVWDLLPEDSPMRRHITALDNGIDMPEWQLNNLIYDIVHVSGRDTAAFSDALVVTRMSRIGCLLEKGHRFYPGIESDFAGGLALRFLPEMQLYYAVRGRVLLMSLSRAALIRALTVQPDAVIAGAAEGLDYGRRRLKGEPLFARFAFSGEEAAGHFFETLEINLHLDQDQAVLLQGRCRLAADLDSRLALLTAGAAPVPLRRPAAGHVEITLDLGRRLPDLWQGIRAALEEVVPLDNLSAGARGWLSENGAAGALLDSLLAASGSGICLSWTGIDQNAMMPMPEIAAIIESDTGTLEESFAALPPPLEDAPELEPIPRYDAGAGIAYLPLIGGPAIEPSAALREGRLFFSNSRHVTERIADDEAAGRPLDINANLLLRAHPGPALADIEAAGAQFAALGLIRGHDEASFCALFAPWRSAMDQIDEIYLLVSRQPDHLDFQFGLEMAAE